MPNIHNSHSLFSVEIVLQSLLILLVLTLENDIPADLMNNTMFSAIDS